MWTHADGPGATVARSLPYQDYNGRKDELPQGAQLMCGRFFRHDVSWEEYYTGLRLIIPEDVEPPEAAYNIAPTQIAPIIRHPTEDEDADAGELVMEPARWGLVPTWWKKPLKEIKWGTFNARSETTAEKPFFRGAFRHGRCLVPMSGFYEWKKTEDGTKQPYAIGLGNVRWFCCAGLWSRAMIDGSEIDTFTILTTTPNDLMAEIHNRMPVILSPTDYDHWLDPEKDAEPLFEPFAADAMQAWKVGKAVGNVRNQGAELARAVD
ncbi:MAG: SOS response-associated peptidase [Pseudomonadota bacterium]